MIFFKTIGPVYNINCLNLDYFQQATSSMDFGLRKKSLVTFLFSIRSEPKILFILKLGNQTFEGPLFFHRKISFLITPKQTKCIQSKENMLTISRPGIKTREEMVDDT